MKKILPALLAVVLVTPSFAVNEAIFDPATDSLYIPRLVVLGDTSGITYSIEMAYLGGFDFVLISATEIGIPEQFSTAYLQGKTFYSGYFGTGVDGNGDDIENVPVVEEAVFGNDGTVSTTGLLNGATATGIPYEVDASGQALFGGDEEEVSVITCGSTDQYFKTEAFVDGVFDSVDLYFFNVADAFIFDNSLTGAIPRCG